MSHMEAKKTEYKGIIYDSKSEAVFARCLEIGGNSFVYHPQSHCGHEWDFLVFPSGYKFRQARKVIVGGKTYWEKFDLKDMRGKGILDPVLIEYKPSMPTMTYVRNLTEQMRSDPINSMIVWGNPWSGVVRTCYEDHVYQSFPVFCNWCEFGWGELDPVLDIGENTPVSNISIHQKFCISSQDAEAAMRHRFDLRYTVQG